MIMKRVQWAALLASQIVLLASILWSSPAPAQISGGSGAFVVTTCGTLSPAYAAGSVRSPTIDVNGNTCSGATVSPPAGGFATAANQTNGNQKTQIVDGSGNVIASTSNNLNVQCANCSGSGASAVDEASFTAGTSLLAPSGGFFQTTATANALTNGQQGMLQLTAQRAAFVNLRNASGTEIGTSTTPLQVSVANTGANATAMLVTGTGGTFPITAASLPLPTGAATSALQTTINTTLGSPFQAGGSIGNTTFAVTNTGTFAVQATLAAETTKVIGTVNQGTSPWVVSGTVTAANASVGATGSAVPTSATFAGLSDGTNLRGWLNAANALNSTGAGIGTAQAIGQFDDVAPTSITENQFGNLRISANRNLYGTVRDAAGNERGANVSAGNALLVDASATTQPISAASLPLPALASTSTKQSDGSQKTQIVDGSGNVIASTSNNLNVQCANCSGSGVSTADEATFTAGTSLFAGSGGFFQTTATSNPLTNGQQGMFQVTANRALHVNLRTTAGVNLGDATTPLQVSLANTGANTNKLLVTPDSVALPANQSVNVSQINGVTPLMGNGATGTGSPRVTIASDNTAFSVNATLSAETTKVIGTVNQGTSPWVVSGTVTAANGSVSATGAAVPASATYAGLSDGTNLNGWLSAKNALNSTGAGVATAQAVGQFDDVAPTSITENQFGNIRMSANRNVYQTIRDAAGNERGANVSAGNALLVDGSATTQPVSGTLTVTATNLSTNVAQINGVTPLMGNGVTGTGSLRVTLASDNTSNSNPFLVNGAVTPADAAALGTTSVRTYSAMGVYNGSTIDLAREAANSTNSTGTGITATATIGQCDDVSPTALTENSFGNARIDCASHAVLTTPTPSATAGGTTLFTLTLAASTNATNVKASAGQLYSISGFNMSSATPIWISLYNNSGTPTCGTSIIQQFMIPGNTTGAGFVHDFAMPKGFSSGIAFCATTGIAGTGSAAASTYVLNIDYK